MIYSAPLLKTLAQYDGTDTTIYIPQSKPYGMNQNYYARGYSCMKFLVAQNTLTTAYVQIWGASNDDTDNIPPIVTLSAFKQGVEYNITVKKFKVFSDAAGTTPLAITNATLHLVGYFQ